jgi:fido (protein-threonine AMPylation protein)
MPGISLEDRLARLDSELDEMRTRLGGLPRADEAGDIWNAIWLEEAHHSTALEGNTLVLQQVRELLANGRAVGSKSLREYLEVEGFSKASRWVYEQAMITRDDAAKLVTLAEIRHIHALVVGDEWSVLEPDRDAGAFRSQEVQQFTSGMTPPPAWTVASAMTDFSARLGTGPSGEHPVIWVAGAHAEFERIRPFRDGNGRTGRLLANLLLVRLGYPPAIILKRERSRYLSALARADQGDPRPLALMMVRAAKVNLDRFIYPSVAGPAKLVPLTALATGDRPFGALKAAAVRNRLKHRILNGIIYSSKNWLDDYYTTKDPRGRKVKTS